MREVLWTLINSVEEYLLELDIKRKAGPPEAEEPQ